MWRGYVHFAGQSGRGRLHALEAPDVVIVAVGDEDLVSRGVDGDVVRTKRVGGQVTNHVFGGQQNRDFTGVGVALQHSVASVVGDVQVLVRVHLETHGMHGVVEGHVEGCLVVFFAVCVAACLAREVPHRGSVLVADVQVCVVRTEGNSDWNLQDGWAKDNA